MRDIGLVAACMSAVSQAAGLYRPNDPKHISCHNSVVSRSLKATFWTVEHKRVFIHVNASLSEFMHFSRCPKICFYSTCHCAELFYGLLFLVLQFWIWVKWSDHSWSESVTSECISCWLTAGPQKREAI